MNTAPQPEDEAAGRPVAATPVVAEGQVTKPARVEPGEVGEPDAVGAEPEVEPVEPVEPVEREVEPVEPEVEPAEPEVEPAEPEVEPADVQRAPEGAEGFRWLLVDFAQRVPDIHHVLVVSADGLLMGMSAELGRTQGDTVAAIVAGLTSLVRGASSHLGGGAVRQAIVEMDELFLLTMSVSDGAVLAVVADADCDVGLVGYEMAMLASRAEAVLTPALIEEARALLPVDDAGVRPAAGAL